MFLKSVDVLTIALFAMALLMAACSSTNADKPGDDCARVEARLRALSKSGDTPNQMHLKKCRAKPPAPATVACYMQTDDMNLITNCEHAVPKALRKTGGDCNKIAKHMYKLAQRDAPDVVADGEKRELKRLKFFCRIQGASKSQETCVSRADTLRAATGCK